MAGVGLLSVLVRVLCKRSAISLPDVVDFALCADVDPNRER